MAQWTRDWPTEPGWYWFYGDPYFKVTNNQLEDRELILVKVVKISNGMLHIGNNTVRWN